MTQIITVSGQPGSGTTTLAERLVAEFNAEYVNAGSIFRTLADNHGMSLSEFSKHVNNHPEIDQKIDYQLREIIEEYRNIPVTDRVEPPVDTGGDLPVTLDFNASTVVIESRLAGWIAGTDADFRFWCQAPLDVRCDRITDSDRNETRDRLIERQADESMRYEEWYGIDITDTTIYDCVINTARWDPDTIGTTITQLISLHDTRDDESATETNSPFLS